MKDGGECHSPPLPVLSGPQFLSLNRTYGFGAAPDRHLPEITVRTSRRHPQSIRGVLEELAHRKDLQPA